jgi:hypothetical protein
MHSCFGKAAYRGDSTMAVYLSSDTAVRAHLSFFLRREHSYTHDTWHPSYMQSGPYKASSISRHPLASVVNEIFTSVFTEAPPG